MACAAATVLGSACRKDKAAPRVRADGGDAAGAAQAPAVEPSASIPATKQPLAEPDVDWMGVDDAEIARRSGITAEECSLALAEGQGVRITVCDFIRQVNALPPRYRAKFDSIERRRELLDDMISMAVMAVEAERLGLDRDPEALLAVEKLLAEKMETKIRAELRAGIREGITEQDEQEYFDAHAEQFSRPELRSAAHIVLETEEAAREVIRQLLDADADATLFSKLAIERSIDEESKARGGTLPFFTRPDVHSDLYRSVDPALTAAVYAMQNIGDINPEPVRTAAGWEVVKLMGKRNAVTRTLDQIRTMIRSRIEEQRMADAWAARLAEIQREVGVELHPENLPEVHPVIPTPEEVRAQHDSRFGPGTDVQVPAPGPGPAGGGE